MLLISLNISNLRGEDKYEYKGYIKENTKEDKARST